MLHHSSFWVFLYASRIEWVMASTIKHEYWLGNTHAHTHTHTHTHTHRHAQTQMVGSIYCELIARHKLFIELRPWRPWSGIKGLRDIQAGQHTDTQTCAFTQIQTHTFHLTHTHTRVLSFTHTESRTSAPIRSNANTRRGMNAPFLKCLLFRNVCSRFCNTRHRVREERERTSC